MNVSRFPSEDTSLQAELSRLTGERTSRGSARENENTSGADDAGEGDGCRLRHHRLCVNETTCI